jgi:hypothetical protein
MKIRILRIFIIILIFIFIIFDFTEYRLSKTVKDFIVNKGTVYFGQQVSVKKVDVSLLKSKINIENLEIKNLDNFKNKSLVQIDNILIDFDLRSIFTNIIMIKKVSIDGPIFNYESILVDKKIRDNISQFKGFNKQKDQPNQTQNNIINTNQDIKILSAKNNKNFSINELVIDHAIIKVSNDVLGVKREFNLNKITFNNLGTLETSSKFKDAFEMFLQDIMLNMSNMLKDKELKNQIKTKLKSLKDQISPEYLKKLENNLR